MPASRGRVRDNESDDDAVTTITPLEPDVMVLFGATGDLARKKLIPGVVHLSLRRAPGGRDDPPCRGDRARCTA